MRRRAHAGRPWLLVVAIAVVAGCARPGASGSGSTETVSYRPATRVLTFALPRFGGGILRSSELAGRPTVINFYASWCTVCRYELPAFERAYRRYRTQVNFIGVNPAQQDTDAAQAALIRATGVTYPTLRDSNDLLLDPFDPSGSLPVTLFVDATGHVVDAHLGGLSAASLASMLAHELGVGPTTT